MKFIGKIVLVTGASRGIGKSIAETFADRGAIVIGVSTTTTGASMISSYLGSSGKGIKLDVSNSESITSFFKKVYTEFGKIDILINNAGVTRDNLLIRMKESEWQSVLNINLTSVFLMSKAAVRSMIKKRYGRIITIGSVIGSIGNIGQSNYSASKAGLIGFSKSLAREVASRGITVNVIAPGFIVTDMTKTFIDKYRTSILSKIPANRLGYPKEIANVVAFFASDEAAYITGETIHVNGGMYMI